MTSTTTTSSMDAANQIQVEIFANVIQEDILAPSKEDAAGFVSASPSRKLHNATSDDDVTHSSKLVGAIDQGTSSTRFLLFTAQSGQIVASAQMEHEQYYPHNGWHEHDPVTLWQNTLSCIQAVSQAWDEYMTLNAKDTTPTATDPTTTSPRPLQLNVQTVAAIGITNQRETVVAWNRITGQPYYNAIVWDDTRTSEIATQLQQHHQPTSKYITATTGLPISSYFAGTKVKWLLDNVPALQKDVMEQPENVCFGTVDTWLLYQLTGTNPGSNVTAGSSSNMSSGGGGVNIGGVFKTDVTNASRWLFMNLSSCQWDPKCIQTVCAPHTLPLCTLPTICPSAYYHASDDDTSSGSGQPQFDCFGIIQDTCGLPLSWSGIPITAVMGDQQAALFGQAAHTAGHAKNTYGTGLFLMMNTGTTIVPSTHGLLTTVAYQIGTHGAVHYALEGSVSHSGATIQWLRDQLGIIRSAPESETLARTTPSNEGMYFCPAFSGLFAPRWRSDARACLVGMTAAHHKGHVCRAALEAAAYQTKEVFDAIVKDSKCELLSLKVDGGGTHNKLMMQFQADMLGVPVVKPRVMETTAMGAAFGAGLAVGVWSDLLAIQKLWRVAETYHPQMSLAERTKNVDGWNRAVSKSLGWTDPPEDSSSSEKTQRPHALFGGVFFATKTGGSISMAAWMGTTGLALGLGLVLGHCIGSGGWFELRRGRYH